MTAVRGRRLVSTGLAVVLVAMLAGCTEGRDVPDVDVAAAASGAAVPDGPLVDGGWPEVAAFVMANADEGRATVVNLFASWCAPCEEELPMLLERSAATPDVAWLGVASQDPRERAAPFVERLEVVWPSVLDRTATTHIELEGTAMPTTAFFDAQGQLQSVVVGILDAERLETELDRIRP